LAFGALIKEIGKGVNWLGEKDVEDDEDGSESSSSEEEEEESGDDDESSSNNSNNNFDTSTAGNAYNKKRSKLNLKSVLITPQAHNAPQRVTLSNPALLSTIKKTGGSATVGRILKKWRESSFGPVLLSSDLSRNYLSGVSRAEIRGVRDVCMKGWDSLYVAIDVKRERERGAKRRVLLLRSEATSIIAEELRSSYYRCFASRFRR